MPNHACALVVCVISEFVQFRVDHVMPPFEINIVNDSFAKLVCIRVTTFEIPARSH